MDSTDRKSTRLNSSHTEIYTLSLHDALPISPPLAPDRRRLAESALEGRGEGAGGFVARVVGDGFDRSEEHTSELQSHRDLHSFPTRRSSDLAASCARSKAACRKRA